MEKNAKTEKEIKKEITKIDKKLDKMHSKRYLIAFYYENVVERKEMKLEKRKEELEGMLGR